MANPVQPRCHASVAILGHSFVRRLGEFSVGRHLRGRDRGAHARLHLNLRISCAKVEYFGFGGAKLRGFPMTVDRYLGLRRFDVIFLQMGSNDLCDPQSTPEQVATHIASLVQYLLFGDTVRRVVVGEYSL